LIINKKNQDELKLFIGLGATNSYLYPATVSKDRQQRLEKSLKVVYFTARKLNLEKPLAVTAYDCKDYVEIEMLEPFQQEYVEKQLNTMELTKGEARLGKWDVSHLNTEESGNLKKLCSKCPNIFHTKGSRLTLTNAVPHSIPTTDDIPIYKKPYRYGFKQREEIKSRI